MKKFIVLTAYLLLNLNLVACTNYRFFDEVELPAIQVTPEGDLISKVEPNYNSIYQNIIVPKCLKCHISGGDAEDFPFEKYEDMISNPNGNVVIPGDSENSLFVKVLLPNARRRMPPRSSQITPLTQDQVEAIRLWVDAGAFQNQ
jgi:hypothetical protein